MKMRRTARGTQPPTPGLSRGVPPRHHHLEPHATLLEVSSKWNDRSPCALRHVPSRRDSEALPVSSNFISIRPRLEL